MDVMISVYDTYLKDSIAISDVESGQKDKAGPVAAYKKQLVPMMEQVHDQREKLAREVERWCKERDA
jgi:indoleamine 2,3-dioxygenase